MDIQLQELIDRIKKDGVSSAEKEAQTIIANAESKAKAIIADAQANAENLVKNAKAETERLKKASDDAITQSARNMILSFREAIVKELDGIVQAEIAKAYSKDMLAKIIPEVVKAWAKDNDAEKLSVLLPESDLASLSSGFTSELKELISKGLEIKPDKTLSAGFRIGVQNGTAFYDYSAESLVELFSGYLNPHVAGLMKKAAGEISE